MKRIAVIISVIMLIGTTAFSAGYSDLNPPMRFDDQEVGDAPIANTNNLSFRQVVAENGIEAYIDEMDGNKALRFRADGKASTSATARLYRPISGRCYISVDVYLETKGCSFETYLQAYTTGTGPSITVSDGMLYYGGKAYERVYSKMWHNITYLVDVEKRTWCLYLDGVQMFEEEGYGSSIDFGILQNQWWMKINCEGKRDSSVWIDNLLLYNAQEPVFTPRNAPAAGGVQNAVSESSTKYTKYEKIRKSVIMKVGSDDVYKFSSYGTYGANGRIKPVKNGDRIMVPLYFTTRSIGAGAIVLNGAAYIHKDGRVLTVTEDETQENYIKYIDGNYYITPEFYKNIGLEVFTEGDMIVIGYEDFENSDEAGKILSELSGIMK